ncbi:uncharacterized protein LOC109725808 [Ananas comosus]|uniref:Uncharacterized protein LOC109725808 n=1 Tax=Ananas comosus TaxID=4615 RepID=A0A6P5GY93_ANACO|nr:uncharacterized protein LOC109725808 [Ananas comosus]
MALGKLTLVIGAGIVGSILSDKASLSDITKIFSGASKIFSKHLRQEDGSNQSTSKPHTDSLLAQVDILRQELQRFATKEVTIITNTTTTGSGTYRITAVIIVGAVGYGYIRWKGWKLSDMMFVTRRGLSDACTAVGKQLEQVSSSIAAAKRHLSSRIDRVDCRLDECKEITIETKDQVTLMHGDLSNFHLEMESVHSVVQNLETKLYELESSQDYTTEGIYRLCKFANTLEQNRNAESTQALPSSASYPAIESSRSSPVTRAGSLPPPALETPSPLASSSASVETPKVLRTMTAISASGLKVLQASAIPPGFSRSNSVKPVVSEHSNGASSSTEQSNTNTSTSSSNRFAWKLPGLNVLSRTRSTAS